MKIMLHALLIYAYETIHHNSNVELLAEMRSDVPQPSENAGCAISKKSTELSAEPRYAAIQQLQARVCVRCAILNTCTKLNAKL